MRIVMESIERLPDAALPREGPVSQAFLQRGAATFRDACRLVKRMPYGPNAHGQSAMALFDDNQGTCTTKHGAIVRLAEECGLVVGKMQGFYRLNEDIVTGIADILRPHGVPFVPTAHCFLEHDGIYVDLTEGNCNGKNRTITEYDFVLRVPAEESAPDSYERYREYVSKYAALEPRLAALDPAHLLDLVKACHAQMDRRRTEMLTAPV